jgi:hypothetical protein
MPLDKCAALLAVDFAREVLQKFGYEEVINYPNCKVIFLILLHRIFFRRAYLETMDIRNGRL